MTNNKQGVTVGPEKEKDSMSNETERPELDLKSIIDEKFASGAGVLTFSNDTPDAVILLSIKQAIAVGKPFTVIPS
jgi:hypothetical protein